MIITLLIRVFLMVFAGILRIFPQVTELPFGIDSYMVLASGYFHRVMTLVPLLSTVMSAFLIYFGFRIGLLVLKFILGSRAPHHG